MQQEPRLGDRQVPVTGCAGDERSGWVGRNTGSMDCCNNLNSPCQPSLVLLIQCEQLRSPAPYLRHDAVRLLGREGLICLLSCLFFFFFFPHSDSHCFETMRSAVLDVVCFLLWALIYQASRRLRHSKRSDFHSPDLQSRDPSHPCSGAQFVTPYDLL